MKKLILSSILLMILLFGINIYLYFIMPNVIVTHWNEFGEPNGTMGKFWGLFFLPLITLVLLMIFIFIPKIDPLKKNIEKFMDYYVSFVFVFVLFMFYINIITLLWNSGYQFNMTKAIIPAVGLLLIYIGVIMKNLKQNWFIGIRTPWTLSNETVWNKTHVLGNKLFIISGVITIIGTFFPKMILWFVLAPILISAIVLVIYSYLVFKKVEKKK